MAKLARLSRMYKIIKLTKLIRILKLLKMKSSFLKYAHDFLKISIGFERLFFFIIGFFLICHIVGCIWILVGQFVDDKSESWIYPYIEYSEYELYITAIYFTVTTITTVGYGDISGAQSSEKIFCILIMVIGVIAFSFASGSLASII